MEIMRASESWVLDLRVRRVSERTIETYLLAVRQLADFCKNYDRDEGGVVEVEEVTRHHVRAFIVEMIETRSAATAHQRHRSLRGFFTWLVEEGEISESPMAGLKPPKVEEKPINVVSERGFELMLKTCDSTFNGKRDEAMLRILWDCGLRVSELLSIRADGVDRELHMVWVEGKTGIRQVPFSVATAYALDRYMRSTRGKHPFAHLEDLWLGKRGRMTRSGIRRMVEMRAEKAGIGHVHPHQFRHSAADRFLSDGMNEGEVMKLLGWSDRSMLDRYGRSVAHQRAIASFRRLYG